WPAPRLAVRRTLGEVRLGLGLRRDLGHLALPALIRLDGVGPSRLDEARLRLDIGSSSTWRLRLDGAWRHQRGIPTLEGARRDRVVPRLAATVVFRVGWWLSLDVAAARRWWPDSTDDVVFVDDGTLDRFGTRLEGILTMGRGRFGTGLDIGVAWLDDPLGRVVSDPGSPLPPNVPHLRLDATARLLRTAHPFAITAFVRARGLRRLSGGPGRMLALTSGPQSAALPLASFAGWELSGGVHASF
ncbi:MAG: hypothetical protein AAF211_19740, partial [Myxococcota bacterium]